MGRATIALESVRGKSSLFSPYTEKYSCWRLLSGRKDFAAVLEGEAPRPAYPRSAFVDLIGVQ